VAPESPALHFTMVGNRGQQQHVCTRGSNQRRLRERQQNDDGNISRRAAISTSTASWPTRTCVVDLSVNWCFMSLITRFVQQKVVLDAHTVSLLAGTGGAYQMFCKLPQRTATRTSLSLYFFEQYLAPSPLAARRARLGSGGGGNCRPFDSPRQEARAVLVSPVESTAASVIPETPSESSLSFSWSLRLLLLHSSLFSYLLVANSNRQPPSLETRCCQSTFLVMVGLIPGALMKAGSIKTL